MTRTDRTILVLPGMLPEQDPDASLGALDMRVSRSGEDRAFQLLDTHVGSLEASGQLLILAGGTLTLLDRGERLVSQSVPVGQRFLAGLQDGPVKAALGHAPPLRSLLRIGSGTIGRRELSLTDDEEKTLVRAHLTTLSPAGRGSAVTIASVQPLRGYDEAAAQLRDHLGAGVDTSLDGTSALLWALFPDRVSYSAKPAVVIDEDDTAWRVANDIIAVFLRVARQNEAGIIADHDTEFLHDYRVALRKVRSVLSLFRNVYPQDRTAQFRRTASELMSPTGPLRDLDVYLLARDAYFAMLPPSLHEGLTLMFEMFQRDRRSAHRALAAHLQSAGYRSAISELQAVFGAPDGARKGPQKGPQKGPMADTPAGDYASHLIWKRYRRVCRIARTITADTPDAQVHVLRIGCKKLRYLMEVFAPLYPADAVKPVLKPLKRLQDNLGLFNDYSVQQAFLQAFMDSHDPLGRRQDIVLAQSIGALIAVLHDRQREERARIMASFSRFDGPDIRSQFRSLFNAKDA